MKNTQSFSLTLSTFVVIALFIGAGILAHTYALEISSAINDPPVELEGIVGCTVVTFVAHTYHSILETKGFQTIL